MTIASAYQLHFTFFTLYSPSLVARPTLGCPRLDAEKPTNREAIRIVSVPPHRRCPYPPLRSDGSLSDFIKVPVITAAHPHDQRQLPNDWPWSYACLSFQKKVTVPRRTGSVFEWREHAKSVALQGAAGCHAPRLQKGVASDLIARKISPFLHSVSIRVCFSLDQVSYRFRVSWFLCSCFQDRSV